MAKRLLSIACMVLICCLYSLAADRTTMSFASLAPEAQEGIKAAMEKEIPIQNFTLTASDGADDNQFGTSVAIDGNTVVIGAAYANNQNGAAYVFVKPANGWDNMTQTAELTASNPQEGDCFGCSVAISGGTIVVGALHEMIGGISPGGAYVFVEPIGGWKNMTETAQLTASDGVDGSLFGRSVAVSVDTILVGALNNDLLGSGYIFVKPKGGWINSTQTAELTASDGIDGDNFGLTVSISGDTAVIGSPDNCGCGTRVGQGYVFVEPSNGWADMTETARLTASDGVIGDEFAWSVSIDTNVVAIGAKDHNQKGAVYVFVEPLSGWTDMDQTAELTSGTIGGCLGDSVSISGGILVGGAPCDHGFAGAAFVFRKPSGGWRNSSNFAAKLAIPFTYNYDMFGSSVAVMGTTGIIGAYNAPTVPPCHGGECEPGPGEAFIFTAQ